MKSRTFRFSHFLTAVLIGAMLLVSLLVATLSFFSSREALEREVSQSFAYRESNVQLFIGEHLKVMAATLGGLANQPSFQAALPNKQRLEPIMKDWLTTSYHLGFGFLAINASENNEWIDAIPGDIDSQKLAAALPVPSATGPSWTFVTNPEPALIMSVPVFDKDGDVSAYLYSGLLFKSVNHFAQMLMLRGELAGAAILADGEVIFRINQAVLPENLETALHELRSGQTEFIHRDGHLISLFSLQVGDTQRQIQLLAALPGDRLDDLETAYYRNMAIIAAITIITTLAVVFVVRAMVKNSIGSLLYYAEEIRQGHSPALYEGPFEDFNKLGRTFETLVKEQESRLTELTENRSRLQAILDNMSNLVYLKDLEGRYLMVNRSFEDLFRISSKTFIGKTDHHLFPSEIANSFRENDRRVAEKERLLEIEETLSGYDEEKTFFSVKFPLRNHEGKIYAVGGISTDITERKLAEEELARHRDHLHELVEERTNELEKAKEEADRANAAKSDFLAKMSHELRTPLNAIIGLSEMLHEDAIEFKDEHYREPLRRVNRSGRHLLDLINDILDISKIEAGKMELVIEKTSVEQLVDHVRSTSLPLAEQNGNKLAIYCDKGLGSIQVDPIRTRQVLLNLLGNASKFTKDGEIALTVTREAAWPTDWIEFTVSDTGIGMPPAKTADLFKDFSQIDTKKTRNQGGTGLGLSISKKIVELMGGTISVESKEGVGSSFTVRLPSKTLSKRVS